MQITKELSPDYCFNLPNVIDIVNYEGKFLVIAREEGNWIVLDNEAQLSYFKELRSKSICDARLSIQCSEKDAEWVITQLVARHFDEPVKYQKMTPVMQLYLTNKCNMRCPHCYMSAGEANDNELTTNEVFNVLEAYKKNGGVDVKLTGGEITLRNDLFEIVKFGAGLGLKMELLTNGILWTEEYVKRISPYITVVQISVDGYNETENAKIRGKGNFRKALDAIHFFATNGTRVHVAITANYSKELSSQVEEYANFAKGIKNKYKDYNLEVFIATGLLPGRYGDLTSKEADEYNSITQNINSRYLGCEQFVDYGFIGRHKAGLVLKTCSYGYPSISSNGDVFMCPIVSVLKPVANIRTTSLDEIMAMCFRLHELSETDNLEPCRHCALKSICSGDCRIRYFEDLKRDDVISATPPFRRKCSDEIKEGFYKLMLETNMKIFH